MIAKARLDALTDGIFAVAMTLLVIDLRFPQDLHPGSNRELLSAIGHLLWSGPFIAYLVSFFVIGVRWRTISRLGGTRAHVGKTFVRWSFVHLFFITCMPFSTMVVGRHVDLAPAVWLYAANTILAAGADRSSGLIASGPPRRPCRSIGARHGGPRSGGEFGLGPKPMFELLPLGTAHLLPNQIGRVDIR